jgi:heterodisulfide reductase subunit C
MNILSQLIFVIALLTAAYFFMRSVLRLKKNIFLGKEIPDVTDKAERWKNVLFLAFGQKKMFKRPIVAVMHLFVYLGFLIVNIELLEILVDGILGSHRIFSPFLASVYTPLIDFFEFFAVMVIVTCVIFLIRRNVIKVARFQSVEMKGWGKLDGNIILMFEIVLMLALLNMNATDLLISQNSGEMQQFFFSNFLIPLYDGFSIEELIVLERTFWWVHIIGVFLFANYVMYSKHLHIFLAFPTTYYASLAPKGKMSNMTTVTNEVKIMMGLQQPENPPAEVGTFGAKDVTDLSRKDLLAAYSCTECGRCTSSCPANLTGKKLSPRKIMMDTRHRAEELGAYKNEKGKESHDGKSLINDWISSEEIFACTSCNACVEECPISINPLSIINELKRYKAMEEAQGPAEWNGMYQGIETSFNPWKFPATDRFNWAEKLKD